ncbi:MAG: hypothetical protein ABIJ12_09820 [bacterium]
MAKKLEGKESDRFRCNYCGYPVKQGRDAEGDYGMSGWDFADGDTDGSELITNGAFTVNTASWTAVACTHAVAASGQSGNCSQLTRTSGDEQYIYQVLSDLDIGLMYRLTAYLKSGTSGDEAFILRLMNADRSRTKYSKTGTTSSTWTQYTLYWRAFPDDNVVCLVKNTSTAGTMFFDTVSVYAYDFKAKETGTGCPFCYSKNWKGK